MYFLLNLSRYVKRYGHLCQIWLFYDARSPNMAMSHDPRSKFRKKIYFFLILHLILGKAAKFVVEKLSTSEVTSQKPQRGGVENTPSPVLLGLKYVYLATILMLNIRMCYLLQGPLIMISYKNNQSKGATLMTVTGHVHLDLLHESLLLLLRPL